MAKVVLEKSGKYRVTTILGGRRCRRWFSDEALAKKFLKRVMSGEADAELEMEREAEEKASLSGRVALHDAILKYKDASIVLKAPGTQYQDMRNLQRMYDYLWDVEKIRFIDEVKLFHLKAYQAHLKGKGLAGSTVNREFDTIEHFFGECLASDLIAKDPSEKLRSLHHETQQRRLWSDEQVQTMLDELDGWAADVFYAIAELGLRPVEARGATFGDIDFERRTFLAHSIKGDGKKRTRRLFMSQDLARHLGALKERRRREFRAKDSDFVFLNAVGKPLDRNAVEKAVKRVRDRLGGEFEGLSLYGLRHTVLTKIVEEFGSIEVARRLAGHTDIRTTQRYMQVKDDQLRDALISVNSSRQLVR